MIDRSLPWLVFPPAVDLANTIVITPKGPLDLLTNDWELDTWIKAERGRIADVGSARGRLEDVRTLRDALYDLLHASAGGRRPAGDTIHFLNAVSRAVPVAPILDQRMRIREEPSSADPFERFQSALARSAMEVVGGEHGTLAECGAPSCGMLFLRNNLRQTWCSSACGNRARVARHAARSRG